MTATPTDPAATDHATAADHGSHDPATRLLELTGEYAKGILADTTMLLELAQQRVRDIPAAPRLVLSVKNSWRELGALLMRHAALELIVEEQAREIAALKADVARLQRRRAGDAS